MAERGEEAYLAMDFPMLVLPTPGGPTKQRILPCVEPLSLLTAMNSKILHTSTIP